MAVHLTTSQFNCCLSRAISAACWAMVRLRSSKLLQSIEVVASPVQLFPPNCDRMAWVRVLCLSPQPQVLSHSLQSPHWLHWQSMAKNDIKLIKYIQKTWKLECTALALGLIWKTVKSVAFEIFLLLRHGLVLQDMTSVVSPGQAAPWLMDGLSTALDRFCNPPPQVTVHMLHSSQGPQMHGQGWLSNLEQIVPGYYHTVTSTISWPAAKPSRGMYCFAEIFLFYFSAFTDIN